MIRTTTTRLIDSPFGPFILRSAPSGMIRADWSAEADENEPPHDQADVLLDDVAARMERYFAGEAVDFSDIPLPQGPPFHQRCWAACRSIPPGETRTYAELAVMAGGSAGGARAAGQAMRRNPLPVIIPCHRVVGSDGSLHGYSGSQDPKSEPLSIKRGLLGLERNAVSKPITADAAF